MPRRAASRGVSTFMATSVFATWSRPWYTQDMPPSPSRRTTRYRSSMTWFRCSVGGRGASGSSIEGSERRCWVFDVGKGGTVPGTEAGRRFEQQLAAGAAAGAHTGGPVRSPAPASAIRSSVRTAASTISRANPTSRWSSGASVVVVRRKKTPAGSPRSSNRMAMAERSGTGEAIGAPGVADGLVERIGGDVFHVHHLAGIERAAELGIARQVHRQ